MENFRKNRVKSFFVNESFSTICTKILSKKTGACPSGGERLDRPQKTNDALHKKRGNHKWGFPSFGVAEIHPFGRL